jgi:hypothetical protein
MVSCRICGKELTNAKSIERGMGSICWNKTRYEQKEPNDPMDNKKRRY